VATPSTLLAAALLIAGNPPSGHPAGSVSLSAARGPAPAIGLGLRPGFTAHLALERFAVTGPGTRFVVGASGAPLRLDTDDIVLLRGGVEAAPGSRCYLGLCRFGALGWVDLGPDAGAWAIRSEGPAAPDGTMALRALPAQAGGLPPGVSLCALRGTDAGRGPRSAGAGVGGPDAARSLELAIETDYELFSLFGDLDSEAAYVVILYGAVSDIYLRDVQTRVELSFVRLWDTPQDLFDDPDPLGPFRDWWNANMTSVARDAAQFLSGRRNFPYGGAAYLSALCGTAAYSVVGYALGFFEDPVLPGAFQYDIHVTAHELGHNCGALHTHDYGIDACQALSGPARRGTIMSYCSQTRSGGNSNTDLRFHSTVQQAMRGHILSSACLEHDCNGNGTDDSIDVSSGTSADADVDGTPDECEDCNGNDTLDDADIAGGGSADLNANGIPDECEPDCNGNGAPDDLDIQQGVSTDLHGDNVPDECEADCDGNGVSDYTQIQADMSLDVDRDAVLDACQDCDGDGVSDLEALDGAHDSWIASLEAGSIARFHAVAGTRIMAATPQLVTSPADLIVMPDRRILVSGSAEDLVAGFDADGQYRGPFVAAGSGGLDVPAGLALSPAGTLLVCSRGTDSVLEYDGDSGDFLRAFIGPGAGGLVQPFGIAIGPGGDVFVTSADARVLRYDGVTGAPLGDFVTAADNGGMDNPRGITFKPDGNLLVASFGTNEVLEYDGSTGAFLRKFNNGGTEEALTLDGPFCIRVGPDGEVYVSRLFTNASAGGPWAPGADDVAGLHINTTRLYAFDDATGNFLRSYVLGNDTGLDLPTGFDFMPGDATDCNRNGIPDSCDLASGASADRDGDSVPDECEPSPGDLDGDGLTGIADLLLLLGSWGPCDAPPDPCPADLDGDGAVGIGDLLLLMAHWS
jgi:hypothetical protein